MVFDPLIPGGARAGGFYKCTRRSLASMAAVKGRWISRIHTTVLANTSKEFPAPIKDQAIHHSSSCSHKVFRLFLKGEIQ